MDNPGSTTFLRNSFNDGFCPPGHTRIIAHGDFFFSIEAFAAGSIGPGSTLIFEYGTFTFAWDAFSHGSVGPGSTLYFGSPNTVFTQAAFSTSSFDGGNHSLIFNNISRPVALEAFGHAAITLGVFPKSVAVFFPSEKPNFPAERFPALGSRLLSELANYEINRKRRFEGPEEDSWATKRVKLEPEVNPQDGEWPPSYLGGSLSADMRNVRIKPDPDTASYNLYSRQESLCSTNISGTIVAKTRECPYDISNHKNSKQKRHSARTKVCEVGRAEAGTEGTRPIIKLPQIVPLNAQPPAIPPPEGMPPEHLNQEGEQRLQQAFELFEERELGELPIVKLPTQGNIKSLAIRTSASHATVETEVECGRFETITRCAEWS